MDLVQAGLIELRRALAVRRPVHRPMVRVGGWHDGGYVLCDDFDDIANVLSFGIGTEASFDLDLARRGFPIHQFDHTVAGPPVLHERFEFRQLAWGPACGPRCGRCSCACSANFSPRTR
jgi:hypothetical protein